MIAPVQGGADVTSYSVCHKHWSGSNEVLNKESHSERLEIWADWSQLVTMASIPCFEASGGARVLEEWKHTIIIANVWTYP